MTGNGNKAMGRVELADEGLLEAGRGRAFRLARGSRIRIANPHGSQVVDMWATVASDQAEYMSMEHTRTELRAIRPRVGDQLYSNRRRPLMKMEEDTSPGVHDTLIAACDETRYRMLGHVGFHRNCCDNFRAALAEYDIRMPVPAPLNLFMNIPIDAVGALTFEPSVSDPGDYVVFSALEDLYVVLSACPQDLVPINGNQLTPQDVEVVINRAA